MNAEGWIRFLWISVAALWAANAITLAALRVVVGRADLWKYKAFEALMVAEKLAERVHALEGRSES